MMRYIRLCLRAMVLPTIFSIAALVLAERRLDSVSVLGKMLLQEMFENCSQQTAYLAALWPLPKLALCSVLTLLLA